MSEEKQWRRSGSRRGAVEGVEEELGRREGAETDQDAKAKKKKQKRRNEMSGTYTHLPKMDGVS